VHDELTLARYEQTLLRSGCTTVFFTTETKKPGENLRKTVARQIAAASCSVEGSESFRKGDLVVDLNKLLDKLSALLGGQLECRGWYLVRFDDIDTA
jgi:hypothetical protein